MVSPNGKPPWLKVRLPGSPRYHRIKARARGLGLQTVCEEARCPNIGECWAEGTATFMIMGDTCTRGCRFCAVKTARFPGHLDPLEPQHVARAIAEMELDYVVITSVDRDDLEDAGASHFAAAISETRRAAPATRIEVLIPDFGGVRERVQLVVEAGPDVIAQNLETVERLTWPVRDRKASYAVTLDVLRQVKDLDPQRMTKSSLMVGLGEREDEIHTAMRDLRAVGVELLTIGQYLRPTPKHLPVHAFVHPDQFAAYARVAEELGFVHVASGPLVRSSYRAGEWAVAQHLKARDAAARSQAR